MVSDKSLDGLDKMQGDRNRTIVGRVRIITLLEERRDVLSLQGRWYGRTFQ